MIKKITRSAHGTCEDCAAPSKLRPDWFGIFLTTLILLALQQILRNSALSDFAPASGQNANLFTVVLIGVAASVSSCLAVVGGLLLSVSAKWSETHQNQTPIVRLWPMLVFNLGRLIGYFVLGGLIGQIGRQLTLSIGTTGVITVAMSIVMLALGLNMLHILPKKYCTIPLPRSLWKRIQTLSASRNPLMPLLLGALTFFVPCGFTQSMQIVALGSGSFLAGGMMMLAFAIGTLPSLLGISIMSSFVQGNSARTFFTVSGTLVVLLGLSNISNGLTLAGVRLPTLNFGQAVQADGAVTIDAKGDQIIRMYVHSNGYTPSNFTIRPNMTTYVYAFAPEDVSGCASFLTYPAANISIPIKKGENWLKLPTPIASQTITLACSMGMYKADIHVLPS